MTPNPPPNTPQSPTTTANPPWYKQRWFNHLLANLAGSALVGGATLLCPLIPQPVVAKVCSVVLNGLAPAVDAAAKQKEMDDTRNEFNACSLACGDAGIPNLKDDGCHCD